MTRTIKVNMNTQVTFTPKAKGKEVFNDHSNMFCGYKVKGRKNTYRCPLHEFVAIFGKLGDDTMAYVEENSIEFELPVEHYYVYFLDGKREEIEKVNGDIGASLRAAGYGSGILRAIDFYSEKNESCWVFEDGGWNKLVQD